jgi:hypothetical protein
MWFKINKQNLEHQFNPSCRLFTQISTFYQHLGAKEGLVINETLVMPIVLIAN